MIAKARDLSQLEEKVRRACSEIEEEMLQNVGQTCVRRCLKVVENEDPHVEVYS